MSETSKTADQALRVLEAIAEHRGANVAELSRSVGLSRTAVHRAVATLAERGYIDRRPDGAYVVGPAVRRLMRATDDAFTVAAQGTVDQLAREHGETFLVTVAFGTDGHAIAQGIGDAHHLKVEYRLGQRHPLWLGASGRAILAFLDRAATERVLEVAPEPDALRGQLADIRRARHARSAGEIFAGIVGVSVPILEADKVVGSLTAVVPGQREHMLGDLLPALHGAAERLTSLDR